MKSTSLSDLSSLIDQSTCADEKVFETLSDPKTASKSKEKAQEKLRKSVALTLQAIQDMAEADSSKRTDIIDYCRNCGAFLLAFDEKEKQYAEVFLALLGLLETAAPSFKAGIRGLRHQFKQPRSHVSVVGYKWEDLAQPFIIDKFANQLLCTEISTDQEPSVIYVEKPVEKIVIQEKVVVKEVIREVEAKKTDPDDFGKEGQNVEFKSSLVTSCSNKPQIWNICKAVCAFLNADGGTLYIGVDDYGRAIPKFRNGSLAGIHDDIRYLRDARRLPYGKTTVDAYCLYTKFAIMNKFRECNDVSKFDSNVIVSETDNDNVIRVEVRPSNFCIVTLEGIAYHRSGASSPEMDEQQIEQRMFELYAVTPEVHYRSLLQKAINEKRQVILYAYSSTSSSVISDRYIEPICFIRGGKAILSYDTEKLAMRQFNLSRIGDIRILDNGWEYESEHQRIEADIFGWTDLGESFNICLDMKLAAMTFLIENHPNAKKELFRKMENGWYRLEANVHSLDPVRNFFLSFADLIEIRDTSASDELKENIAAYVSDIVLPKVRLFVADNRL